MTAEAEFVRYERHTDVVVVVVDNPPVNALNKPVRASLLAALDLAEPDSGVKALVLTGSGRTFIAGADITEFGTLMQAPLLTDLCTAFERSRLCIVVALHGFCLGGGLELALSADYRVAHSNTRLGFPEVHLGLIPGAGGTQRLPRLVGAETAIEMITTGRHVGTAEALRLGILDDLSSAPPQRAGIDYARHMLAQGVPKKNLRDLPAPEPINWDEATAKTEKAARGLIAPEYAVRAVRASAELDFNAGKEEERRLFNTLMKSDQRQAMIHVFFAERAAKAPPVVGDIAPRDLAHLGVVGGGTMGAGIATAALIAGLDVTLLESSVAAAETARDRIAQNLEGALQRGKMTAAAYEKAFAEKLVLATEYDALSAADAVIEAVYEDMAVKRAVFSDLDAVCKPGTLLATNTSYLDVREVAAATARPQNVLGLHFFSPAHVMKLVEVVVPDGAAPETIATGFCLAKRLGKIAVQVGVSEGFVGNRILNASRRAADHMVLDGATPEQIDAALVSFGFAMGPYTVADLTGLDIGWAKRKRIAATRDPRERVAYFPDRLCEAGHFGQKSGRGYYLYTEPGKRAGANPKMLDLVAAEREQRSIALRDFTEDEIISRYMAATVNEAARVIEEGIARCPRDVDLVLIAGYGFPRHRGGPCKWADLRGLSAVLSEIENYTSDNPHLWTPAPLLERLVREGQTFQDLNRSRA